MGDNKFQQYNLISQTGNIDQKYQNSGQIPPIRGLITQPNMPSNNPVMPPKLVYIPDSNPTPQIIYLPDEQKNNSFLPSNNYPPMNKSSYERIEPIKSTLPLPISSNPPNFENAPFLPNKADSNPNFSFPSPPFQAPKNFQGLENKPNQSKPKPNMPKLDNLKKNPYDDNDFYQTVNKDYATVKFIKTPIEQNINDGLNKPDSDINIQNIPKIATNSQIITTELSENISNKFNHSPETLVNNLNLGEKYFNEFIKNFSVLKIRKTCCERFCCIKGTELFRLKRLKEINTLNENKSLIEFITTRYKNPIDVHIQNYSVIDLYLICSLLENNGLMIFINKIENFFSCISAITAESINILSNEARISTSSSISKIYFNKMRQFIVIEITQKDIRNFNGFSIDNLVKLLKTH